MNPAAAPPAVSEETLVDQYLAQLAQLSPNARLELIARLSQTLKIAGLAPTHPVAPAPKTTLLDFAGAWAEMPGSDEEIMASVRNARSFTRPEISLD